MAATTQMAAATQMAGIWITIFSRAGLKYWIMMDYGKTKNSRMNLNASIG